MIIIIGGGPAGLAMAYRLQERALPYRLLERETVGATWRDQYDSLALHTPKGVSALPGQPLPASCPTFPPADRFFAYLQRYAHQFGLNITEGVNVQQLRHAAEGWHLRTNAGDYHADAVVLATGIWQTPNRPHFEGEAAFKGRVMHSQTYQNVKPFRGQRVLVVGAGNSGAEIAVELAQAGIETSIAVRSTVDFMPYIGFAPMLELGAWLIRQSPPPIARLIAASTRRDFSKIGLPSADDPLTAFPVVGFALPEMIKADEIALYPALERFRGGYLAVFADGQMAPFDAVILATGYRPTLDFLPDGLVDLGSGPHYIDNGRVGPQLYALGFDYPTTEGWLQALPRESEELAAQLAQAV